MSKQTCKECGQEDEQSETMCSLCGTPYPVPDPNEAPEIHKGQLIANRYVILDRIGQGGMGCIYKVQDNTLGEVVALKTLLPAYVQDKIVVERFFNEARIARGLSHPHIVRVHDIGTDGKIVYISMELLPGRTLRSMLDKMLIGKRIPLNAILRMFDALCAALEYAHNYTVHRDIKPENVMVLPDGTVKLMDFGISKLMSNPNLTSASMIMGTPHYMSPEQLKNSANVDGRADIYSVGVMLYEALTGAIPTSIGQRSAIQNAIPPALSPIVQKCCQDDPNLRYQKIGEVRDALRKVRKQFETGIKADGIDTDTPDTPTSSAPPVIQAPSQLPRQLGALAGVLALCAIAFFVAWPWANAGRTATLDNAVEVANTALLAAVKTAPIVPDGDTFPQLRDLMVKAKRTAHNSTLAQQEDPFIAQLLSEADSAMDSAVNSNVETEAMAQGWKAMHRYLALAYWPTGMDFISEGTVQGRVVADEVPAFFMDEQEVSAGEFRRFANSKKWRVHQDAQSYLSDDPMGMVTYYDANGFLHSQNPKKQLPTAVQFTHTVAMMQDQLAAEDAEGSTVSWIPNTFYEWTRLNTELESPEKLLGTPVNIMGVQETDDTIELGATSSMPYESFHRGVGFRGVIEMPTTIAEAEHWLRKNNL